MVKVTKVAVWKVDGSYFEDAKQAEKVVRQMVIEELLTEQAPGIEKWEHHFESRHEMSEWVSMSWDAIENRTKAAMAGT